MPMADYDIFREQLAIKYPSYGHALWGPSPSNPDRPVQVEVGDVGFIRRGDFHRLFNALLPADDPSHELGVPEYYKPLVPKLSDHLRTKSLNRNNYCSAGVSADFDLGYRALPDDFPQVSFQCKYKRPRGAAVLSLPVTAQRKDTLAQGDFGRWIAKHIDTWFAFARGLGLGIEEIILVTGCDLTRSWTNIAFLENEVDAQVSFGVEVQDEGSVNFQFLPENARGAVLLHGPEGMNLPENQCVFIRGFRASRSFWKISRRLKAAGGHSSDPGGYDCDPDTEVFSLPAITKYRDPLHLLLDHVAEQASGCDIAVVHDDDLVIINGIGNLNDNLPETLEPDVMMDLLWRSNIEIHKVLCEDSSPTNSPSGPNTDMANAKVALLSMTFKNWKAAFVSQWSPPEAPVVRKRQREIDLGHTSDSLSTPPPAVPGNLPVPTTRGRQFNDIICLAFGLNWIILPLRRLLPRNIVPVVSTSLNEAEALLERAEAINIPSVREYRANLAVLRNQFLQMRTESHRSPWVFQQLYLLFLCGLTWRLYALEWRIEAIGKKIELAMDERQLASFTNADV